MPALMLGRLYAALRAGDVPEQAAREAAEEVASYKRDIAGLRTEIRVVQGLVGAVVVLLVTLLWQLVGQTAKLATLEERFAGLAERVLAIPGQIDSRSGAIERRLEGIERRLPPLPGSGQ